ncbi:hypothetical protein PSHT_15239, partial [Puccinia striiformis]
NPSHPNLRKSPRTREAKRVNILIKERAHSLAVVDSKSDKRESGDETSVNFGNLLDNLWTLAMFMEVIQPTVRLTIPNSSQFVRSIVLISRRSIVLISCRSIVLISCRSIVLISCRSIVLISCRSIVSI